MGFAVVALHPQVRVSKVPPVTGRNDGVDVSLEGPKGPGSQVVVAGRRPVGRTPLSSRTRQSAANSIYRPLAGMFTTEV